MNKDAEELQTQLKALCILLKEYNQAAIDIKGEQSDYYRQQVCNHTKRMVVNCEETIDWLDFVTGAKKVRA